jgi:phosphate starvation-inducible PhoH-like protein
LDSAKTRSDSPLERWDSLQQFSGVHDRLLKQIEKVFGVEVVTRNDRVHLLGERRDITRVERLMDQLNHLSQRNLELQDSDYSFLIRCFAENDQTDLKEFFSKSIAIHTDKRLVAPKSLAQKEYLYAIERHDLVFGIGPAGTGKTYLAMACAIQAIQKKRVDRIVLTRPAVEAGEKLGFLPGDLYEKINPYLRPLYDALYDLMDMDKAQKLLSKGQIEIAPLAYMRGRTLNNSFIILDEAQNTTSEQMKMFLTRMGQNSKSVITGDVTQIDLPHATESGLVEVERILKRVTEIQFVYFSERDLVRHDLVRRVIQAYEQSRKKSPRRAGQKMETEADDGGR